MSRRNPAKSVLLGLLAVAGIGCSNPPTADAGDLMTPQRAQSRVTPPAQPAVGDRSDVVGTITAHGAGAMPEANLAENALAAQARFLELRAAMERDMALRRVVPKEELAALERNMKQLSAHLSVLIQGYYLQSSNKARNAPGPAQDFDQACAKIINELHAAVERDMSQHEVLSKDELAAVEGKMKQLSAQLSVLIQTHNFQSRNKAKNALDLAQDWYETSSKVINPPAGGLTALPLPMIVSDKADLVAAALDEVLAEAQSYAAASRPIGLQQKRAANLRAETSNASMFPGYASW